VRHELSASCGMTARAPCLADRAAKGSGGCDGRKRGSQSPEVVRQHYGVDARGQRRNDVEDVRVQSIYPEYRSVVSQGLPRHLIEQARCKRRSSFHALRTDSSRCHYLIYMMTYAINSTATVNRSSQPRSISTSQSTRLSSVHPLGSIASRQRPISCPLLLRCFCVVKPMEKRHTQRTEFSYLQNTCNPAMKSRSVQKYIDTDNAALVSPLSIAGAELPSADVTYAQ
jgi:hypothetical protein